MTPARLANAASERMRPRCDQAVKATAAALGAGTAGLVNALDPEVVTLGGLAVPRFEPFHSPGHRVNEIVGYIDSL